MCFLWVLKLPDAWEQVSEVIILWGLSTLSCLGSCTYILWSPALSMLPKGRKKVSVRAKPTSYLHLTYLYVEALTPITLDVPAFAVVRIFLERRKRRPDSNVVPYEWHLHA